MSACRVMVWLIVLSLMLGCEFKGGPAAVRGEDAAAWRPRPVRLRVYPSTRFVREGGRTLLEARVEFLDAMGDSIKGVGRLRFELLPADDGGRVLDGRLHAWDVSVRTLEQQRRYYDPITRAYLFRLRLDDERAAARPTVLKVTFTPAAGGERLGARARVGSLEE